MVIVDTSVWVTYLREGSPRLEELLFNAEVVCHPFVIGELACGNIKNRNEILSLLQSLPMVPTLVLDELLYFIERNQLMALGVGLVDVHRLASARVSGISLWTSHKRLESAATRLGVAYQWQVGGVDQGTPSLRC